MSSELPGPEGGGLATYTRTMSRSLAARGHDVHVLSCAPGRESRSNEVDGVTVHERPIVAWPWLGRLVRLPIASRDFRTAVSVRRHVASLARVFDVVQVADFGAEGLLLRRGSGQLVVRISAPTALLEPPTGLRGRIDRRVVSWMERRVTRRADTVITPSRRTGELLAQMGWLRRPAHLIRTPVDLTRWDGLPPPSAAPPVVVTIGRVEHLKGIDRLIDALAVLGDVPARLVLVGRSNGTREGVEYATWASRRAAGHEIDLEMLGAVEPSELPAVLSRARVFAMVSRFDNFPNAALEAMAAGRPVVCTPNSGIHELIDGSEAGSVADPDPTSIANALRPFLVDPTRADQAGRAARRLVEQHCSPAGAAVAWEALIASLTGGGAR